ncbi:hypothetical protein MJT46_018506 [Ovis ammon polii x Ovis aries]|nr:hypothetical protein MJT46_018506 [Ovis ammon polii x Ovis aries]
MGQMAGEPQHLSTLLHHLFTVQGLSVWRQQIEACLQTAVECNTWFPDEGNSSLPDIQKQEEHLLHESELDDETLQKAQLEQRKIFQNFPTSPSPVAPSAPPLRVGTNPKVSPLLEPNDSGNDSTKTLFDIKTDDTFLNDNDKFLPHTLNCNSSPPDIWKQAEHLLHEYELDDETLQKAQLEQHKIFQNFPTSPSPVAPSAPPLRVDTNPKVSPLLEPNDSGNDSTKTLFDIKTDDTFLNDNDKFLPHTLNCNSSPPDIWKQAEHLLHEYELDDETLQKAQLEQHKIFQNFPTSPSPVAPSAPPLRVDTNPKVSPLLEPNDSGNDSTKTLFDIKTDDTFLNDNDKFLPHTLNCNSSPPDIWKQAEHLLHEYELDDETLQKAQLEQHKIFQNFPTSPSPVAPSAPPLRVDTNPKVSPLLEPNDSGNDSTKTLFDIKTDDTFLNDNDKFLPHTLNSTGLYAVYFGNCNGKRATMLSR